MKHLIFVLYDSITNSVFEGQVLTPLINKLAADHTLHITIISFERNQTAAHLIQEQHSKKNKRLSWIMKPQFPFIGRLSLYYAARILKKTLANYYAYKLIARGPLAGWICLHAYHPLRCTQLIIQARGLLAEEYQYTHQKNYSFFHRIRTKQYAAIEAYVYKHPAPLFEAVSTALTSYMHTTFATPKQRISIAHEDIPNAIDKKQICSWRTAIRAKLNIPDTSYVICYNGSLKPWQCPIEMIQYVQKQLTEHPHALFLILTQDTCDAEKMMIAHGIPASSYRIYATGYDTIYQYLSAADEGLLFREQHIINWVSRPTKLLEYRAIGLKVTHNNTVAYAQENQE